MIHIFFTTSKYNYLFFKIKDIAICFHQVCASIYILKWQISLPITPWQSLLLLQVIKVEESKLRSKMFGCSTRRQLMHSKSLLGHFAKPTTTNQQ